MTTHYLNGRGISIYLELIKIYDKNPYIEYDEIVRITGRGFKNSTYYSVYKILKDIDLKDYDVNDFISRNMYDEDKKFIIDKKNNTITSNEHHSFHKIDTVYEVNELERKIEKYKRKMDFLKKYRPRDRKLNEILNN